MIETFGDVLALIGLLVATNLAIIGVMFAMLLALYQLTFARVVREARRDIERITKNEFFITKIARTNAQANLINFYILEILKSHIYRVYRASGIATPEMTKKIGEQFANERDRLELLASLSTLVASMLGGEPQNSRVEQLACLRQIENVGNATTLAELRQLVNFAPDDLRDEIWKTIYRIEHRLNDIEV